jgi:hemoglobin
MDLKITEFPTGARPAVPQPNNAIYSYLGEEGIRKLVNDHYNLLVQSSIKHLFPAVGEGLELAKKHSADFFIQRLGGPNYYDTNRGKPMLTKRHEPFTITQDARKVWLDCYRQLLPNLDMPKELILSYWIFFDVFSIWMVNSNDVQINLNKD